MVDASSSNESSTSRASLPPLPTQPLGRPLRVVVLTCSTVGWQSAAALVGAAGVDVVAVVRTPELRPRSALRRLRNVYRYHGLPGILRLPWRKLAARWRRSGAGASATVAGVPELVFRNFHDAECLAALRELRPDLAVVDGTYVLKAPLFELPRFGSVNIHCGKLPDFRGAPPAFWELLHGEPEVGITIHRVTAKLDEGPILRQAVFPLELMPAGDPVAYATRFWLDTLRPNALQLLRGAVEAIAAGAARERPQGPSRHATHRLPDWRTKRTLRRVVRARRAATGGGSRAQG